MKNPQNRSFCLLIDNGSLAPASTKNLRKIAGRLASRLGEEVTPVSLLHSDSISVEELDGYPARRLDSELSRIAAEGGRSFLLIPLFFGPSAALTDYLPAKLQKLKAQYPEIDIRVAPPLAGVENKSVPMLAKILQDLIGQCVLRYHLHAPGLIVVDHGSPVKAVTQVRDRIAEELSNRLKESVIPASMERREGGAYAFNEPLLESALETFPEKKQCNHIVLAMLFLSPGRHAGQDGDIERICQRAKAKNPDLKIFMTDLVSVHPGLIDLLQERYEEALLAKPF
ncbi:MAG: hypothetical protein JKY51_02040 [Opitutaceae bacterium]|nr:hypothetical protein [Opitutaceae bacterium]